MEIILFQGIGILGFFIGTVIIGVRIRKHPTKEAAEKLSRVSHGLFWLGLVLPEVSGILYPGLAHFDELLGLSPLPSFGLRGIPGWLAVVAGVYYLAASNRALKSIGSGFAAFKLTRQVVRGNVYETVRNPMSLGMYLVYSGIGLIYGSTYVLAGASLVIMPVHIFNLVYFEEKELRARHGDSYEAYRGRVPFLIPWMSRKKLV